MQHVYLQVRSKRFGLLPLIIAVVHFYCWISRCYSSFGLVINEFIQTSQIYPHARQELNCPQFWCPRTVDSPDVRSLQIRWSFPWTVSHLANLRCPAAAHILYPAPVWWQMAPRLSLFWCLDYSIAWLHLTSCTLTG